MSDPRCTSNRLSRGKCLASPSPRAGGIPSTSANIVTPNATGSDSQGEALTYAWDLNYNGSTFNSMVTGGAVTFDPSQLGISSGSDTVAVQATNTDGSSALATAAVTIASSTTGTISGRVTEDGAGVAVTAHVDGDNHCGLYYGGADGSAITYIGRNEFGGDGSLGGYNWTDAETYNFHMPGSDYLYVAAWDGSPDIAGFLAEFDFANGSSLLSDPNDWSYTIAGASSGDNGNAPGTAALSNWIAAANSNNSWTTSSPDAVSPNCDTYNLPEINPAADDLWTTAFTDTFYNFVIFRAALPAGLASSGSGGATGVAGCTVFADDQYDGQLGSSQRGHSSNLMMSVPIDRLNASETGVITNTFLRWDWVSTQVAPVWQFGWDSDPEEARTNIIDGVDGMYGTLLSIYNQFDVTPLTPP